MIRSKSLQLPFFYSGAQFELQKIIEDHKLLPFDWLIRYLCSLAVEQVYNIVICDIYFWVSVSFYAVTIKLYSFKVISVTNYMCCKYFQH